jgi:hypothetical protein
MQNAQKACPSCGRAMRPTWDYCPYCRRNESPPASNPPPQAAVPSPQVALNPDLVGVTQVKPTPATAQHSPPAAGETESPMHHTRLLVTQPDPDFYVRLVIKEGKRKGRDSPVGSQVTTIGSGANNDIIIDDEAVSEKHCAIRKDEGQFTLHDLGSTNGVWLCFDDPPENQVYEHELSDGDVLKIGETKLLFICREL